MPVIGSFSPQKPIHGENLKPSSRFGMFIRNPPKAIPKNVKDGLGEFVGWGERHKMETNALSEATFSRHGRGLNQHMWFFFPLSWKPASCLKSLSCFTNRWSLWMSLSYACCLRAWYVRICCSSPFSQAS